MGIEIAIYRGTIRISGGTVTTIPQVAGTGNFNQVALPAGAATLIRAAVANRLSIIVRNDGANDCWLGFTNAVTAANGTLLRRFEALEIRAWAGTVYGWAAAAAATNIGYLELVI